MPKTITIGSKSFTLPNYAPARILIGTLLVFGGFLGFLPILGFWMVPLGVAILSYDIPRVRLFRQKVMGWWRRRK